MKKTSLIFGISTCILAFSVLLSCSKNNHNNDAVYKDIVGQWAIGSLAGMSTIYFDDTQTAYPILSFSINGDGGATVGCNSIYYLFKANSSGVIVFADITITDMACGKYGYSEVAITNSLTKAKTFKIEGSILTLYDSEDKALLVADRISAID